MSELKSVFVEVFKDSPWRMIWAVIQIIIIIAVNVGIVLLAINMPN